ncbi:MAG TPA: YbaK/EbsC family protein [Gemmatimonadaceae bacterium]
MPVAQLKEFLDRNNVRYITITHSPSHTAQTIAASAHVPGKELAKSVMLKADGRMIMAVLPGPNLVDIDLLRDALGADRVELATEREFRDLFPDCELGAMPPFGGLYGLPVFVADVLTEQDSIAFNAGNFRELIRLSMRDYERLAGAQVLHFAATV